ncbi:hypothetical protein [Bacillus sp. OTU530]|uniref:hypothetical protein n=1 Tax=Bacillus sp. OTU530 TaxID=3043862 RepID=UPI00313ADF6C
MKIKTLLFSMGMIGLIYFISKHLHKYGNKTELLLFVLLMVYTTYEGIAELQGLPHISIIYPVERLLALLGDG